MTPSSDKRWRALTLSLLGVTWSFCALRPVCAYAAGESASLPGRVRPGVEEYRVTGLIVSGLQRTNRAWIESYMGLSFPARMNDLDAQRLARKLLTTEVFSDVRVAFEPSPGHPDERLLHVAIEEKWTTIPVVRGTYGGGTPLRVVGAYETHAFGRLMTLGGEMRKYGDAPPGYVLYARDPRSHGDRYYLGAEVWRDFHRRQVYSRGDGRVLGAISTNKTMTRLRLLTPWNAHKASQIGEEYPWKYGVELEGAQEAPSIFDAAPGESAAPPKDLVLGTGHKRSGQFLPTLLFDNVDVDNIELDGLRAKLHGGLLIETQGLHPVADLEVFGYKLLPHDLNLAAHLFVGGTTYNALSTSYFLGGFDSIRGLPDGAIFGTHAAYANLELRHVALKTKYLWVQTTTFADGGCAGATWADAATNDRASAGIGARFAVPQVYRLVVRVDYAWEIGAHAAHGLTVGMNQFFDPYKPL